MRILGTCKEVFIPIDFGGMPGVWAARYNRSQAIAEIERETGIDWQDLKAKGWTIGKFRLDLLGYSPKNKPRRSK